MVRSKEHSDFILYKPSGYLSQFINNQTKRTNKKLLGSLFDFPDGIMAIGRLDEKSEGLLLLTCDGKLSEFVRSNKIEKEYYAQVDGILTEKAIINLQNGVNIGIEGGKYKTKPCVVFKLEKEPILPISQIKIRDKRHGPTSWISITLKEGKYRQVRKMTAAVGFPTLRLSRIRIGNIKIGDLKVGEVQKIAILKEII